MKLITSRLSLILCLIFTLSSNNYAQDSDKIAILEVMKAESEAYYQRDYKGWKKTWYQSPACSHAWNNRNGGFTMNRGWKEIHSYFAKDFKENPEVIYPNYYLDNVDIHIKGEMAIVTSDEYVANESGEKYSLASGTKILVKDDNEWKLHSVLSYWEYDFNKTKDEVLEIVKSKD